MAAKRLTAAVWRERIEAQRTSRMSIRGWCRENGVHEHGFHWWRSRLKMSSGKAGRPKLRPRFAEVVVTPLAVVAAEPIRFRLGGERELVLPGTMAMAAVAMLAAAVMRATEKPLEEAA